MTRSALLQLLAHPASLTEANVRELEQLAQAFPYCQTAHLLLAKAAHDQGSMLASQRLRRAATYAADRALLRQLIELPAPAAPMLAEPAAAENEALTLAPAPASSAFAAPPAPIQDEPLAESAATEATLFEVEHTQLPAPASAAAPALEPLPETLPDAPAASPDLAEVSPDATITSASQPEAETAPEAEAAPEDELPAQAPPIRPPAEAEAASQEFGLAMAEPADIVAYQLPELLEVEETPASLPIAPVVASVLAALPAFAGAADVGYAPGEGSRLGFCLQSPLAEAYSLTTGPAALLPSAQLPPASEFFAPDAQVLAHLEEHRLPVAQASAPIATDLINSFLQRGKQAGPRRRAAPPLPDAEEEEQPDLSGPSTRAVPDLASENLAKILARQGKPDRAIAIYERLMVKHPEKIAYFTAQIDSLRPQA
jgi:predicted negative regulator of RcsB-dependent stress response